MQHRRDFLKNAFLALGGLSLPGFLPRLAAAPGGTAPMRFIFMHRGNGLFPRVCVPPTLGAAEQEKEAISDDRTYRST